MAALMITLLTLALFGVCPAGFQPETPANPPAQEAPAPDDDKPPVRPHATELAPNLGWLNTDRPLLFSDQLKGHVVVLDFWTSCCINCMHAAEDLKALEEKYQDQPVVFIGVHSAKFTSEAQRSAIRAAVHRGGIKHPVVIDDRMAIWQAYDVRGWPSFIIIGPDGLVLARTSGEGRRDMLDAAIRNILEYGRKNKLLATTPLRTIPDAGVPSLSGLAFPGKVLAVAPSSQPSPASPGWLFIADSAHDRVIAATWPDADGHSRVVRILGESAGAPPPQPPAPTLVDGPSDIARFNSPQGLAYDPARAQLYIADTRNHAVRAVSTRDWTLRTLAGNGARGGDLNGGRSGRDQPLASPWDLALSPDGKTLAVAMAGSHQLWTIDTASGIARRLAGAGGESLFDGPAADAALAQPSGLALTPGGERLYFVDAESSSLRVLDAQTASVHTIVGHDLFVFGYGDGPGRRALLQHPLGVALFNPAAPAIPPAAPAPVDETLLVADTFNDALRLVDGKSPTRDVTTWSTPDMGLDEPGGLCVAGAGADRCVFVADTNNHRILMIDASTKALHEVTLLGLDAPGAGGRGRGEGAAIVPGTPVIPAPLALGRDAELRLIPELPAGVHLNAEAPLTIVVRTVDTAGRTGAPIVQRTARASTLPVSVTIPPASVRDGAVLLVETSFGVCTDEANATCQPASFARVVTISGGTESVATLR